MRRRRRIGIRWWLGLAFATVGLITAASVYLIVTRSSEQVISQQSGEIAVGRTVRIADRLGSSPQAETPQLLERYRARSYSAWAFDRRGQRLSPRGRGGARLSEVPGREEAIAEALTGGRYLGEELPGDQSVVAVPIFRGGVVDGALLAKASRPLTLQRAIEQIRRDSLIALGIAIVLGLLVSFWVAGRFARRIRRLARSAEHIAAGRFDIPLPSSSRDELGDLGESLEEMRERLRESFSELESERDRLSAIFAGLTDSVLVIAEGGDVRFGNPAAAALTREDGRPVEELLPLVEEAVAEERAQRDILAIGERLYGVQARHLPAEAAVLLVVRDRTEELRRELAEAEFVSNAAHELRNPIAGIASSIEVLQAGAKDDPEARERFLQRLATEADRLTRITQSLLTLARVEATHVASSDELSVAAAMDEALEGSPPPEGIEVACEIPDQLRAAGDRALLRQVLSGLLSNAYKHTPAPGRVTVTAKSEEDGSVRLEVADTGPGIPADELGRVFERFYRGTGALEQEGFGLGLPIAKRMVDVMRGEIGVSSQPGRGSTFWVRLPAVPAAQAAVK